MCTQERNAVIPRVFCRTGWNFQRDSYLNLSTHGGGARSSHVCVLSRHSRAPSRRPSVVDVLEHLEVGRQEAAAALVVHFVEAVQAPEAGVLRRQRVVVRHLTVGYLQGFLSFVQCFSGFVSSNLHRPCSISRDDVETASVHEQEGACDCLLRFDNRKCQPPHLARWGAVADQAAPFPRVLLRR